MSLEFENNGILQQQKFLETFKFFFFWETNLESLLLLRRANCYLIFVMMFYQHLKSVETINFITQRAYLSFPLTVNGDMKSSYSLILNLTINVSEKYIDPKV